MHHPPYVSSDFAETSTMRWPVRDWGADVVLSGHHHAYERLSASGIPYIVNGAGGNLCTIHARRPDIIFDVPFAQRWLSAAEMLGIDINRLSTDAGHA